MRLTSLEPTQVDTGLPGCRGHLDFVLPRGLRLQRLRLAQAPELRNLPEGLEIEGTLELNALEALKGIPGSLLCGGDLLLRDMPSRLAWGAGIEIKGNLLRLGTSQRIRVPDHLRIGGTIK